MKIGKGWSGRWFAQTSSSQTHQLEAPQQAELPAMVDSQAWLTALVAHVGSRDAILDALDVEMSPAP